jgi:hypothetical protein
MIVPSQWGRAMEPVCGAKACLARRRNASIPEALSAPPSASLRLFVTSLERLCD